MKLALPELALKYFEYYITPFIVQYTNPELLST